MSIQYTNGIGTATKFGAFGKILLMWNGSVYKLVFPGLGLYLIFYFLLSIIYRFFFTEMQRRHFENLCVFCEQHSSLIPLSFVLAFYVGTVVTRWWDQWSKLPYPDNVAFSVNAYCRGMNEESRLIRRTVTRYTCLSIVITFRNVSSKVFKRFPTLQHLVDAGLMTEKELVTVEDIISRSEFLAYFHWIPLSWASSLVHNAYQKGHITDEIFALEIQKQILLVKRYCGEILSYDWINVPLAYTQVVTLAVYAHFGFALLGRQYLDPKRDIPGHIPYVDYVVPIFTILQFLFYVGWIKVAEVLINPFGEDDDDFDLNWLVDRNLQVTNMMIDDVGQFPPKPVRDVYWEVRVPDEMPYTVASLPFRGSVPPTSSTGLEVSLEGQQTIPFADLHDHQDKLSVVVDGIRDMYDHLADLKPRASFSIPGLNRSRKNTEIIKTRNSTSECPDPDSEQTKHGNIVSESEKCEKDLEKVSQNLEFLIIPSINISQNNFTNETSDQSWDFKSEEVVHK